MQCFQHDYVCALNISRSNMKIVMKKGICKLSEFSFIGNYFTAYVRDTICKRQF